MLENATRICEARFGMLWLYDGKAFQLAATHNVPAALIGCPREARAEHGAAWQSASPPAATPSDLVHTADELAEPLLGVAARFGGARSLLAVPMRKDSESGRRLRHLPPGGAAVYRQADRAGDELRRSGRDRHREHATAQRIAPAHRRSHRIAGAADRHVEVLKVISSSPGESGAGVRVHAGRTPREFARPSFGSMMLLEGDFVRRVALHNPPPE